MGLPSNRRLILSGGLTSHNVARGIEVVQPWGVDVSSGVESEPGIKDARKVRAFVRDAKDAVAGGDRASRPRSGPFDWNEDGGV